MPSLTSLSGTGRRHSTATNGHTQRPGLGLDTGPAQANCGVSPSAHLHRSETRRNVWVLGAVLEIQMRLDDDTARTSLGHGVDTARTWPHTWPLSTGLRDAAALSTAESPAHRRSHWQKRLALSSRETTETMPP